MLLEAEKDLQVVFESDNPVDLQQFMSRGISVDIAILDVNLPEMDGIELAKDLHKKYPETKFVMLSMMDNIKYVVSSFNAGAKAFLIKNISHDEMLFALRHVYRGEPYLCTEISMALLKDEVRNMDKRRLTPVNDLDLSERELQVINLIADGFTNQEIAERLYTSKRTVEGYRQQLLEKTGARNSAALVKYACQNHILT